MNKLSKSEAGRLGGCATKNTIKNRIENYNQNPKRCLHCNSPIQFKERNRKKFCNRSCAASHNNKVVVKRKRVSSSCLVCNKSDIGRQKFCSMKCYGVHYTKYDSETLKIVTRQRSRFNKAKYRARLKNQIPPNADLESIREFYRNCPPGYEVDHIIPISKGGLHTLENLQYLTKSDNCSKGAKLNWMPKKNGAP
jgi:hypothetical protein